MPTVLLNKKLPPHKQNIYQQQSKQTKNRESHGGVGQDKRAEKRARISRDQPAVFSEPARARPLNTSHHRTKKRSTKRRLLQITAWVDEPLMLQLVTKSRKRGLSMSSTVRRLLRKVVSEDEKGVDAALDTESVQEQHASDYRRLASRLTRLLVMLLFDVGQIKAHTTNMLSMQKGMSEELFKDILQDADRRTKSSLSRLNPELTDFVDAIETWLMGEEEDQRRSGGETNGHRGRGGARA